MKFYSPKVFRKLNENESLNDLYIEVSTDDADKAKEVITSSFSDSQYVLDGENFYAFGVEDDAKLALDKFNEVGISIVDSNLEEQVNEENVTASKDIVQTLKIGDKIVNDKGEEIKSHPYAALNHGLVIFDKSDNKLTIETYNDITNEHSKIIIYNENVNALKDFLNSLDSNA